jgi:1,4-dihydroxy-6-naphthoate synthase
MDTLSLGYSPCPNDTFIFTAWMEGMLEGGPRVQVQLEDIATLNQLALAGGLDIIKVSFHAFGHIRDNYCLLHSGGALGRGCGPLVVAGEAWSQDELKDKRIAIPGKLTTAALLLHLFQPELNNICVMPFDQIMPATRDGIVDAGLIIHESRFTYRDYGLHQIVDLGEWWEAETGHAIPLGGIVMRRDLGKRAIEQADAALASSVEYAHAHPEDVWPTVRRYAQEMEDEVMRQHIELYVNSFTYDYGAEGEAAIRYLMDTAQQLGIIPNSAQSLFGDR